MTTIGAYRSLFRPPVAFFVTCSAVTGYSVASPSVTAALLPAAVGVFLLACGASALNQFQERDIDALMERTRRRPLPAGRMSPGGALAASFTAVLAGLILLGRSGLQPIVLGVLAVVWYNGVYTPLKRRTPFAAVYGAPVGMLPPAIGWTTAGGGLADPRLFAVAMVFFLWQVPHFWFLLLGCGDDYERAGLPSLCTTLPRPRLVRIAQSWTVSTAAAALLLPLYGIVGSTPARAALLTASVLLALITVRPVAAASGFRIINAFIAALMVLISADALLMR